jgi:hypothetical protein
MSGASQTAPSGPNRRGWRVLIGGAAAAAILAAAVHLLYEHALANLGPDLGLTQTVYTNPDFTSPAIFARYTTDLGLGVLQAQPELPQREISIAWEGYWVKTFDGPFRLYAGVDDEVRVWIDDALVIDRSVTTGFRVRDDPIAAVAGVHRLRIEFVQRGGSAHLSVLWARADGNFHPFPPEALFHAAPGAGQLEEAARVTRLRVWRGVLIPIAVLLAIAVAAPAGVVAVRALQRHPRAQRAWSRSRAIATARGGRRYASFAIAGAATAWTAWHRAPGLDPQTLWADDIWVAALASLDSLWTAVGSPAPVPPGFLAAQWLARRVMPDLEIGLQALPFVCGLAVPLVVFAIVARITSSHALGLVALAVASLDPLAAQVSVFAKQYTLDALLTAALLWLAVRASARPASPPATLALAGLAAAPFSFPSLFLSMASVHVATLRLVVERAGRRAIGRAVAIAAAFDVLLGLWYLIGLRPRVGPSMVRGWLHGFMPSDSLASAWEFVAGTALALVDQALPGAVAVAAPLVLVGLLWLLARQEWRWTGLVIAAVYVGLLLAAALRLYPVATGYAGRVVLFSDGLLVCLAVIGLHALTRLVAWRSAANAATAAAAMMLVVAAPARVEYFEHDHARFVDALRARAAPDDVVVLNARAAHLVAAYGQWPVRLVPDGSAERFHMRVERPRTLTLRPAPEGAIAPEAFVELRALLLEAQPRRVFFFTTRRDFDSVLDVFDQMGYELVELAASTTRTRFMVYERFVTH